MTEPKLEHDYSLGPYIAGTDFPLLRHALTLVENPENSWALEFGVHTGQSLRHIAAVMPTVGFDSFLGLPEFWRKGFPRGSLKLGKATKPPIIANTRLVIGWFEDTLPVFDYSTVDPIGLVHIDCDIYASAKTALRYTGPHLRPGCIIVFDEWMNYPGCEDHEQKAWKEWVQVNDVRWEALASCEQGWAIRIV